jgi:hypothetical protein
MRTMEHNYHTSMNRERITIRSTRTVMLLCCLSVVLCAHPVERNTLYSGTVVVLEFLKYGMVVAADSREERRGSAPYDRACKITPLGTQMFFAGAGMQSGADENRVRRTFGPDFAHAAYQKAESLPNNGGRNLKVVEEWGESMRRFVERRATQDPNFASDLPSDTVAQGLFGSSTAEGKLLVYVENIHYSKSHAPRVWVDTEPQENLKPGQLLKLGAWIGVQEFYAKKTGRAISANRVVDERISDSMAKSVNASSDLAILAMPVEYAIRYAEDWNVDDQHIGGDVDSLLLWDGRVQWIHVKDECRTQIK